MTIPMVKIMRLMLPKKVTMVKTKKVLMETRMPTKNLTKILNKRQKAKKILKMENF